jgi:hypothetical protein
LEAEYDQLALIERFAANKGTVVNVDLAKKTLDDIASWSREQTTDMQDALSLSSPFEKARAARVALERQEATTGACSQQVQQHWKAIAAATAEAAEAARRNAEAANLSNVAAGAVTALNAAHERKAPAEPRRLPGSRPLRTWPQRSRASSLRKSRLTRSRPSTPRASARPLPR